MLMILKAIDILLDDYEYIFVRKIHYKVEMRLFMQNDLIIRE